MQSISGAMCLIYSIHWLSFASNKTTSDNPKLMRNYICYRRYLYMSYYLYLYWEFLGRSSYILSPITAKSEDETKLPWHRHKQYLGTGVEEEVPKPCLLVFPPDDLVAVLGGTVYNFVLLYILRLLQLSFCPWILIKLSRFGRRLLGPSSYMFWLQFRSLPQMNELKMLRLIVLVAFGATNNLLPSVWWLIFCSLGSCSYVNWIALIMYILMCDCFLCFVHYVFVSLPSCYIYFTSLSA